MSRTRLFLTLAAVAALLAVVPAVTVFGRSTGSPSPHSEPLLAATPLSNAFTYQGKLTENGAPANGSYDLQFILYDSASGGAQVGTVTETEENVQVTQGLFAVTLDFGAGAFNGDARWLEIAVRAGTSTGGFTVLSPRQPVTGTPYALYAKTAGGFGLPFSGSAAAGAGAGVLDITNTDVGSALKATSSGASGTALTAAATGSGGTGAALSGTTSLLLDGPVKVTGAKTAFVTPAVDTTGSGANVCDSKNASPTTFDALVVDSALTNSDPNAMLFVTINGVPATDFPGFGVAYAAGSCGTGKWAIYSTNHAALVDGMTFNVLVIKQ